MTEDFDERVEALETEMKISLREIDPSILVALADANHTTPREYVETLLIVKIPRNACRAIHEGESLRAELPE